MRFIFCGVLLTCAFATECFAQQSLMPTNRVELFNGRDFSGLSFCMRDAADPAATWSVTNGVIHCNGKASGYVRTTQSFRDFKLTVECRFVSITPKADNTGVMVHIQTPDKVWPPCVQVQGKHTRIGDLFLMAGAESKEHLGKDANTALPMRGESTEKPVGEWNLIEVVCKDASVKAIVNGKELNEATECTVTSGYVGIQSEGSIFEIGKLFIEPLSTSTGH